MKMLTDAAAPRCTPTSDLDYINERCMQWCHVGGDKKDQCSQCACKQCDGCAGVILPEVVPAKENLYPCQPFQPFDPPSQLCVASACPEVKAFEVCHLCRCRGCGFCDAFSDESLDDTTFLIVSTPSLPALSTCAQFCFKVLPLLLYLPLPTPERPRHVMHAYSYVGPPPPPPKPQAPPIPPPPPPPVPFVPCGDRAAVPVGRFCSNIEDAYICATSKFMTSETESKPCAWHLGMCYVRLVSAMLATASSPTSTSPPEANAATIGFSTTIAFPNDRHDSAAQLSQWCGNAQQRGYKAGHRTASATFPGLRSGF